MRNFIITAAAMTALMASVPASALENHGPVQVGNQCFKAAPMHERDRGFGSWSTCPQQASLAASTTTHKRK